jgi:hypothetical protein
MVPDAWRCSAPKLQAYPDEYEELPLTSISWEYGKPQLYGRAVESVQEQPPVVSCQFAVKPQYPTLVELSETGNKQLTT